MITPLILALALAILVGIYVARPLLIPHGDKLHAVSRRDRLLLEKEELLARVRELDYDVEAGKLPAAEHQRQRVELVTAAARILQQLDELDAQLEKKIQSKSKRLARGDAAAKAPGRPVARPPARADDDIEAAVARLRHKRAEPAPAAAEVARFCTQCGHRAGAGDRFCAACGGQLPERPTT